eukprot:COSAG01_NODE_9838_length_2326_cov_73.564885_3_plen_38_part_00
MWNMEDDIPYLELKADVQLGTELTIHYGKEYVIRVAS